MSPSVTKRIQRKNVVQNQQNTGHNPISYLLTVIAIGIMLYIGVKYINSTVVLERSYAQYAFLFVIFGLIGFFSIDYFDNRKINIYPKKFNEINMFKFVVATGMMFIGGMMIDFVTAVTIRYALSDLDLVLYYIFAAVCEELAFRVFLLNFLIFILTRKSKLPHPIVLIIALLGSSIAFMAIHLQVYGSNMPMLVSTFFGGLLLGGGYIIFRDISANMMAHALKNGLGYINLARF
jgi:membrane protease YdiL (CAAX protease family)